MADYVAANSFINVKREYGCGLTLVIQRQKEKEISLQTKGDIPLRRLLLDYCDQMGLIYEVVRFVFDGRRIKGHQTPDELEMDDGDIIDAFSEQTGGAVQVLPLTLDS